MRFADFRERSRLPKVMKVAFAVPILVLGFGLVRSLYPGQKVHAATVPAFTVVRAEKLFDSGGTLRFTFHYLDAVRSDGSRVSRATTNLVQKREIFFTNGDQIRANDSIGRKSTYMGVGFPPDRDPARSCIRPEELRSGSVPAGEESIGGYRASKVVRVLNASSTLTIWYGLDLGCAQLETVLRHETGVTEQKLAAVIPGETDSALFQVAASYVEVPPSQLFPCPEGSPNCALPEVVKARIDGKYNQLHPAGR